MLTDWIVAAAESQNFPVQSTSIPGVAQRTGATTYHIELVPTPQSQQVRQAPADPDAGAGRRRRRSRRRQRIDGSRPRHRRRLRHARPHHDDRLDQPLLSGGGEDGDGRRTLRPAAAHPFGREEFEKHAAARSRSDRARERRHDQRGDARRHRRRRRAADPGGSVRSGDPRRRQGGRRQSARFPRRLRRRARPIAAALRSDQTLSSARRVARRSGKRNRENAGSRHVCS